MSKAAVMELEQAWSVIHGDLVKLTRKLEGASNDDSEFRVRDYMEIYRTVYKLCTQKPPHNYSQEVYDKYREYIDEYITQKTLPASNIEADEFTLSEFAKAWEDFNVMLRFLSNMFYYLDRHFLRKECLPALKEVGITSYRDRVYLANRVIAKNVVIERISRERDGEEIDRALLKDILNIFVENGFGSVEFYKNDFEVAMLEDMRTYYSRKADLWISELSFTEYLLKAEESLEHERGRVTHYLHSSSEQKLLEVVQNELLLSRATHLVENMRSGCLDLLRNDQIEDLSRLYRLFSQIPEGLTLAAEVFEEYVIDVGLMLVRRTNDAVDPEAYAHKSDLIDRLREDQLVDRLLELHHKSEFYVTNVFQNNVIFHQALTKGFEVILNNRYAGINSAEFFALFLDNVLKTPQNTADGVEDLLKYTVLPKYLNDKTLFGEFCNRNLAKRLLFDQCSTADNEWRFLLKLKSQIPVDITEASEKMLNDFREGLDLQDKFKVYFDNSNSNIGMDLNVIALRVNLWPPYKSSQINLPQQIAQSVELFKDFCSKEGKDWKLKWMYSLGTGKITVEFDQKPIEITASTYQIAVVFLFNRSERLSYEEIESQSNLEEEELAPVLRSLACGEYKILLKEPINNEIAPTDNFQLNLGFTNTLNEIKIPFQRPDEEKKKVYELVDEQRKLVIKAAMMRIMKREKVLARETLFRECRAEVAPFFEPAVEMMEIILANFIENTDFDEGPDAVLIYNP